MGTFKNWILPLLLLACTVPFGRAQAWIGCPPKELISPFHCSCVLGSFDCRSSYTDEDVAGFVTALRTWKNLTEDEWLNIEIMSFYYNYDIETLDLSPFINTHIDRLWLEWNDKLWSITGGPDSIEGEIRVNELSLNYNAFTDEGLQGLSRFSPEYLKVAEIHTNFLTGGSYEIGDGTGDIEFLPGLSRFTNLTTLNLYDNQFSRVAGGQFKRNVMLTELDLSGNSIQEIGENAFLMNPPPDGVQLGERYIWIQENRLGEEQIHPNHGMDSWLGVITVLINFGSIRDAFLAETWEKYLAANDGTNFLREWQSDFIFCDSRMEWLRDGKEEYAERVSNINCENDPGHSIFTTELDFSKPFFECPTNYSIRPCFCSQQNSQLHTFICEGSDVTEANVTQLLPMFRLDNGVSDTEKVNLALFHIEDTPITNFELTILANTKVTDLNLVRNPSLTHIDPIPSGVESLEVDSVSFRKNALTDEGLGESLSSFSAVTLKALNLDHNQLVGGEFKGLETLTNLETLSLAYNKIERLEGGQFKSLGKLSWLDLSDNLIIELGEDALLIDPPAEGAAPPSRFIRLSHNKLNNENVNDNHGLNQWSGQTVLDFNYNQFETLTAEKWEPFLTANEQSNTISLYKNGVTCDERVRWLKDGRDTFEERVRFADCANDPGHNVFTTDLV